MAVVSTPAAEWDELRFRADEFLTLRHLPGQHSQKSHGGGGVGGGALTGDAALAAPPMKLTAMDAAGDPRAAAVWYRTGDNSLDTDDGRPGFMSMNEQLRSGQLDPEMKARVADIDSAMAQSALPKPIKTWRGSGSRFLDSNQVGREFTDKAYVSVSTDSHHALGFGSGPLMRITAPAGTHAMTMADRDLTLPESEILLDRNLRFRVTADTADAGPGRERVLDVEVLP